ncbi:MAG TPA: metal-dependent hydrolase [Pyrinomonadaceae bacterium]|nr:metal-dependent hydrolase [Pyrinomonadaceae bacterium]
MDNLTHSLLGLAAAKAGCERLSPGATAVCLLAANAPDADVAVLLFADRWSFLHYHRHITHSIIGTLAIALLLPLIFWLGDRGLATLRSRSPSVRLKGLVLASLIVSATHPLLDWTNNYGVRLLLPWSSKWFYGDLVFIVDPFIWLLLGSAVFLLTAKRKWQAVCWSIAAIVLTYLVMTTSAERGLANATLVQVLWVGVIIALVLAHRLGAAQRWGPRLAQAAFLLLVIYWTGLGVMHAMALKEVNFAAASIARERGETVTDFAAMPTLANPFRWLAVAETDRAAYRFEVSLTDDIRYPSSSARHERADTMSSPFLLSAVKDRRARIFLGFARFPVYGVVGADCLSETIVQLADLRYTQPGSTRGTFALEVPVACPPY